MKVFMWEVKVRNVKSWSHMTKMWLNSHGKQQEGLISLTRSGCWETLGYRREIGDRLISLGLG